MSAQTWHNDSVRSDLGARVWLLISAGLTVIIVALLASTLVAGRDAPIGGFGDENGKLGGDFALTSTDGPVSLSDYRGKVVVVYFGFLNCEEVCLNSMRVLQNSMLRLNAAEQDAVRIMLISIDPARDTPEALARFARSYHDNIIGLTGSQRQIDQVSRLYGAHYKISDEDRNDPSYFFRHSSRYYVVDQHGELIDAMRHSTTPNELTTRVRQLLSAPATAAVEADS